MDNNAGYVGLELTSKSVKLVVGYVLNDLVYILNRIEEPCNGLESGLIVDSEEVVKAIKKVVIQASEQLHMNIKQVALALPPFNLCCMSDSNQTNTISSEDIVSHIDITNIITAMKKGTLADDDLKIIDVVPDSYIINGNERYTTEPVGKISRVLQLHAQMYAMSNKVIRAFTNCVENAGLEVKYTVIAPYASSLYLASLNRIPESYILIDMGHSLTTVTQVHNKSTIVNSKIIKFGGKDVTEKIATAFNLTLAEAENLKDMYGIDSNPSFPIHIKNEITFDDLSNVIIKAFEEPLENIKDIIKRFPIETNEKLPIVLIGGCAELNHVESLFADELDMEVIDFNVETIGARDKSFITALGLIKYWDKQPKVNENETLSAYVTRVDTKRISKNTKNDDEL